MGIGTQINGDLRIKFYFPANEIPPFEQRPQGKAGGVFGNAVKPAEGAGAFLLLFVETAKTETIDIHAVQHLTYHCALFPTAGKAAGTPANR